MHGRIAIAAANLLSAAALTCVPAAGAHAQEPTRLEQRVEELRAEIEAMRRKHEAELEELRDRIERADADAEKSALALDVETYLAETEPPEGREETFVARGLGLQSLNPELSVVGDFLTRYSQTEGETGRVDFDMRLLELHFEAYLDPFSKLSVNIGVNRNGAALGEGYLTWFSVLPRLNITAGKFRQSFGVVNRWHIHALDQTAFPLALQSVFGTTGLNQTGFSFEWGIASEGSTSHDLVFQLTGGTNDRLFGNNAAHLPSLLLRYKNYRDLSPSTYLELGATGLVGWNDEWTVDPEGAAQTVDDRQSTFVLGIDATLLWEPTDRMRYANFLWRTEAYFVDKGIVAADGSGPDDLRAWGLYSYVQSKVSRTIELGIRGDVFVPDTKSYADLGELGPLAVTADDPYRWRVGPYATWWQSPWVRLRLELGYEDGRGTGPSVWDLVLQITFAAGPHKHERY